MRNSLKHIGFAVLVAGCMGQLVFAQEELEVIEDVTIVACLNGPEVIMPVKLTDETIYVTVSLCPAGVKKLNSSQSADDIPSTDIVSKLIGFRIHSYSVVPEGVLGTLFISN